MRLRAARLSLGWSLADFEIHSAGSITAVAMGYGLAGDLEWHEVEEVVDRLIDYFESNNWSLSSIIMDGDNLINPKEWIETLRKKVSYTFSGLTINFVEN